MHVIEVRNVHEALRRGMSYLEARGVRRDSRVGEVLVAEQPVTTVYRCPKERVLFWAERDANPFFHFMESLWMLAGRNDVAWVSRFSSNISQFSDDGAVFHGPYGFRWINYFVRETEIKKHAGQGQYDLEKVYVPFNQLEVIAETLKKNPNDRRCVLQMWDAEADLGHPGKDVPCNTQIYFKINVQGELDMAVLNRSNDIIWGAYGANAVHMSMLQEFMAAWIGVEVGRYWQISNDWHAYVNVFEKHREILKSDDIFSPYEMEPMVPFPLVNTPIAEWIRELMMFVEEGPVPGMRDPFFRRVAAPLWASWFAYKNKEDPRRFDTALNHLVSCSAPDWRLACEEWILRRKKGGK